MNTQLPAFLINRQVRGLADAGMSGLGGARPPHVSRKGNRFTLVDAAGNEKPVVTMDQQTGALYIDIVIVDVNKNPSKMFFGKNYDPDSNDPPLCWSDNGVGPSSKAAQPQSPTCAICPNHVWGSAVSRVTGAATRACRDGKKLAVLVSGDAEGLLYEFLVPPASFSDKQSGWTRYCASVRGYMIGNRQADLCDVITRVSFLPGQTGILGFQPVGLIDEAMAQRIDAAWASNKTAEICGMTDTPRDPSQPIGITHAAPKPAGQLPPPPLPQETKSISGTQAPLLGGFVPAAISPMAQPMNIQTVEQVQPMALGVPNAAPPASEPPKRGRPPKNKGAAPDALDIPPFLQRGQEMPAATPSAAPAFGIVRQPAEPPNEVLNALDQAFNLKTG